ncbi:MAG: flagellar basal-body rod protein FlgF [Firmicutes bacterium]|nr:flagellar basal-body rod protein FlgF [Bacillota bacterium]
MIRGIYTSALGMNVQAARLDSVSNNLANVSVPGYKKDRVLVESFPQLIQLSARRGSFRREVLGETNAGAAVQQVVTDHSRGMLKETGNPADLALGGPGYFVLAHPQDEDALYYSRNGSFNVDGEGYLVNQNGYRVMSDGGPVQITEAENFMVDENGNITENGVATGNIYIVDFPAPDNLERVGHDLYRAAEEEPQQLENPGLLQRFLESANVDPVEETVNMITASRAYETGQKLVQAQDGMLDLAINKVGLLR